MPYAVVREEERERRSKRILLMQAPSTGKTMSTYDNVSGGGAIIFSAVNSGVVIMIMVVSVMVGAWWWLDVGGVRVGVVVVEILDLCIQFGDTVRNPLPFE